MRAKFFLLNIACLVMSGMIYAQSDSVTITEVMFDPDGSESSDEFIELYNYSRSTTYDLTNWLVSDSAGGNDSDKIVNAGEGLLLHPGQYAVIIDSSSYNPLTYVYQNLIPDTARILFINNATLGSGGLNNSSSEVVMLIKSGSGPRDTLSRYRYSLGNTAGYSDEKIVLNSDNSSANWTNSIYLHGTPGNHPELILSFNNHRLAFDPPDPVTGDPVQISVVIKNMGIAAADSFIVNLYEDTNMNSSADDGELIDFLSHRSTLARNDSVVLTFNISSIPAGKHLYLARIVGESVRPFPDTTSNNKMALDSIQTRPAMDLMINRIHFSTARPRQGDSLFISANVKNVGLTSAASFKVKFFKDLNRNHSADADEWVDSAAYSGNLLTQDSVDISIGITVSDTGKHMFHVLLTGSEVGPVSDENPSNDLLWDSVVVIPLRDSVTITEVMFKPEAGGTADEFFEIYNHGTRSADLSGWRVWDNNTFDTFTDSIGGYILNPGQYAVIFPQTYSVTGGRYKDLVPENALILKTSSGAIGNQLGDTADSLRVINSVGDTVSRYAWNVSSAFTSGLSHEKVQLNEDNSAGNWTNSLLSNGTPGNHAEMILSIGERRLTFAPSMPPAGSPMQMSAKVFNRGIMRSSSFVVHFFEDTNRNYQADVGELIDSVKYLSPLYRGDSAVVSLTLPSIISGSHRYIARLSGESVLPHADTTVSNKTITDSMETIPAYDAALSGLYFSPAVPTAGNPVFVTGYIRNAGVNALTSARVHFYRDYNFDHQAGLGEFLDSAVYSGSLAFGDSAAVTVQDDSLVHGLRAYLAEIVSISPLDEKANNNAIWGTATVSPARNSIVINEINYDSAHGSTEWIELYNRSSDTLDLNKWRIADGNTDLINFSSAFRTITSSPLVMLPGTYAIVGKDSNQFFSKYGRPLAPTLFINFPNLNNSGDMIGLFDSLGTVIDSLLYDDSWGGGADHSLERISADAASYLAGNWSSSVTAGTPGFENSIKPKEFDLAVTQNDMVFVPEHPSMGNLVSLSVRISNPGLSASGNFTVKVFRRAEHDSVLLLSSGHSGLPSGGSLTVFTSDTLKMSHQSYATLIEYAEDQNILNNYAAKLLHAGARRYSVIVNEVNYLPSPPYSEWLELFNRSVDTVNLKKWRWSDEANYTSPKTITESDCRLHPSEYLVIAKDSALFAAQFPGFAGRILYMNSGFLSLNNSGDMIFLSDSLGSSVDSLFYDDSWGGGTDLSLERISADSSSADPRNWRTSESPVFATPGRLNSLTPVDLDMSVHPNDVTFSPPHPAVHQPVTITAKVRNKGLRPTNASIMVRIYHDLNSDNMGAPSELIDSVSLGEMNAGDSAIVVAHWTVPPVLLKRPLADSRIILVQTEFPGDQRLENGLAVIELKVGIQAQAIVINEVLFNPDTSQVEFVELYNPGPAALNLQNWTISDASSTKIISAVPHFFAAQGFTVLTGDSSFFEKFPQVPDSLIVVIASMPSLNNTDDKVILRDDVGNMIDSLQYFSSWGGGHGQSLERKNYAGHTNDPANWVTAVTSERTTPGTPNSILFAQAYVRNTLIINEIMYSPFTDEPEYIEIYNPADTAVRLLNWVVQVGPDKSVLTFDNYSIPPKDYLVVSEHANFSDRFSIPSSMILLIENGLPTLSNSGTSVVLRDLIGTTIDSVRYDPTWGGGNGISLERIRPGGEANSPDNWGSCVIVEGGTPGTVNSNFAGQLRKKIKISADPDPFLVDQGQSTKITVELPVTQARITVKIFDNQGRLIRTLLNNALTGSHREIEWNGKDNDHRTARMGIYIIFVEVIDAAGGFNKTAKKTVVLGRKL